MGERDAKRRRGRQKRMGVKKMEKKRGKNEENKKRN